MVFRNGSGHSLLPVTVDPPSTNDPLVLSGVELCDAYPESVRIEPVTGSFGVPGGKLGGGDAPRMLRASNRSTRSLDSSLEATILDGDLKVKVET